MHAKEQSFVQKVKAYYHTTGRHDLPWRKTTNPYRIAVSEIMLQQTQVPRVIEKYKEFLKAFPTINTLAEASLADVLRLWSGLGYNRRAKFLHTMAQKVVGDHKGKFPKTIEGLKNLPGIGPYTAGAIYAFSYNKPYPIIETNIRTVYIHHFFPKKKSVSDADLIKIIEKTIDIKNPRVWYWALMDYGSYLKASGVKNNSKSKHYTKQTTFEGSKRQIRGAIIRKLLEGPITCRTLATVVSRDSALVQTILHELTAEGLVTQKKTSYQIN